MSTAIWSEDFQQVSLLPPLSPFAFRSVSAPFTAHWKVSLYIIRALAGARGEAIIQRITQGF